MDKQSGIMDNQSASINKIDTPPTLKRNFPANILCFSHLRWDFVFQRPQHLLTRFSKIFNIYYFEEPIFENIPKAYLLKSVREENLWVLKPHLPEGLNHTEILNAQEDLVKQFLNKENLNDYAFWYYTPMALEFSRSFEPSVVVYDCMDELSAFKFAPPTIKQLEKELFRKSDVVFTGGHSLYEAKQHQHPNIFPFPSSIDKNHFGKARTYKKSPKDQLDIGNPRIGFFGVIDERFDLELIRIIAESRPEWQLVLIGPVVKIDPATLPQADNIHYLGSKAYLELPEYLSGWDVALIPFLINESTQFISPTKTPEYLAAGIPVVSSPIKDVIRPYGDQKLVHIASSPAEFIAAIDHELTAEKQSWLAAVDEHLLQNSWDLTCSRMLNQIKIAADKKVKINKVTISSI
jgi:glycosyltransferase involved in cell wall biosynthesis